MSLNNSPSPAIKTEIESLSPIYAGNTRNVLLATDPLRQQPVPDLPGEHGGVLLLVFTNGVHDRRCGNFWFAASDNSSFVVSSFIIPDG